LFHRSLPDHAAAVKTSVPLKQFLQHSPNRLRFARPDGGDSLISQIRCLLGRDCSNWLDLTPWRKRITSLANPAQAFAEEGSSFHGDHLRCDLAIWAPLACRFGAIQDIAAQLGFPSLCVSPSV
jgi:hypothetical protein